MTDYNQIYFQGGSSGVNNAYSNSNYAALVSLPCGNKQIANFSDSYNKVKRYIAD